VAATQHPPLETEPGEPKAKPEAETKIEADAAIAEPQSTPDCAAPPTPPPPSVEQPQPPPPPPPPPPLSQMQMHPQMLQHQQMQQHMHPQMHPQMQQQMQMGMHPMIAMGQAGMPGMGMMAGMGGGQMMGGAQMMGMHPYSMQMAGHGQGASMGPGSGLSNSGCRRMLRCRLPRSAQPHNRATHKRAGSAARSGRTASDPGGPRQHRVRQCRSLVPSSGHPDHAGTSSSWG